VLIGVLKSVKCHMHDASVVVLCRNYKVQLVSYEDFI